MSLFSLQGLCGNSSAVKHGPGFIQRTLPLTFTKKLLLLLLMLIRGAMICMGKEFSPRQCDVLPLGIAVITIMKVAVINQHHSHYLY